MTSGPGVVELDRAQERERDLADVRGGHAAALDVPGVDEQPAVGHAEPARMATPAVDGVDAGERQELDDDVDAEGRARSQSAAKAARIAGMSGSPSSNTPPPTLIFRTPSSAPTSSSRSYSSLGGAALLAVEVPVAEELELDVADAVVGEDPADGRQAVAGDRGLHVVDEPMPRQPTRPETSARSFRGNGLTSLGAPG